MTEGHPCFVANSGRLGFDAADYLRYAPEAARAGAARVGGRAPRPRDVLGLRRARLRALLADELGRRRSSASRCTLRGLGLDLDDYLPDPGRTRGSGRTGSR